MKQNRLNQRGADEAATLHFKTPIYSDVVFCRVSFRLLLLTLGGRNRLWKGYHGRCNYISRQTDVRVLFKPLSALCNEHSGAER